MLYGEKGNEKLTGGINSFLSPSCVTVAIVSTLAVLQFPYQPVSVGTLVYPRFGPVTSATPIAQEVTDGQCR